MALWQGSRLVILLTEMVRELPTHTMILKALSRLSVDPDRT